MKKTDEAYLQDIKRAVERIQEYLQSTEKAQFQKNFMQQDAIIRQLEIIGEAVKRLSREFIENNPDFPIKEANAMRNFLIHSYDDVNIEIVWKTLQEDIPLLEAQLQKLLPQ